MQTAFVFAAIAAQSAAFTVTPGLSAFRLGSSSIGSFGNLNCFSSPIKICRNYDKLLMVFHVKSKDKNMGRKDTALLTSTAGIYQPEKVPSKNPLMKWFESVPWPSKKELKKLLPLGTMLFFILFNYTILRDTKVLLLNHVYVNFLRLL